MIQMGSFLKLLLHFEDFASGRSFVSFYDDILCKHNLQSWNIT